MNWAWVMIASVSIPAALTALFLIAGQLDRIADYLEDLTGRAK